MVDDSMPSWNSSPKSRKKQLGNLEWEREWEFDEHERDLLVEEVHHHIQNLSKDNGITTQSNSFYNV